MGILKDTIDQYLYALWRREPVHATKRGIHSHDDLLPDFTSDAVEAAYEEDQRFLSSLSSLDPRTLDTDEYLDRAVAVANLERSVASHEHLRPWQTDPCVYERAVIEGLYSLIERDHAPVEQRARSALSRLRQAPQVLRRGRANLTQETSRVFAETALKEIQGGIDFLETAAVNLAQEAPDLTSDLIEASESTLVALSDFETFVGQLSERCEGDFAVGKDYYDFLLEDYHLIDIDSEELLALGRQSIEAYQTELDDLAQQIAPGQPWAAITAELKRDHPSTMEEVLHMYQKEVDLARAFVMEKDLVTVPDDDGFWVTQSPSFVWATIPFGSTHPPRPFEDENAGYWEITPPDPDASPDIREQKLQGHNRWNARAIALHEGYPGHHMHYCVVKRLPSKVRRHFFDTVFVEGWGLYTEDLMWESGFFDDPRIRLIQLVNGLWRAVRIVVDVSLHSKLMSPQECVDMLVNVSRLEPVNAEGEVARYAATPTQAASYLLGKTLIMDIRDECQRKAGPNFGLKDFHDELLSYGAISPSLVREQMLQ
jgi:uncharacterized protein (DUF885 family)